MDDNKTRLRAPRSRRTVRAVGIGLLALTAAGAAAAAHAAALSQLRLWCAVLLVQGLALAAVAGVALLALPPGGLARRAAPRA